MNATERHRVRKSATEHGHAAACSCGWRTTRRNREQRDQDVDAHTLQHTADRITAAITWTDDEARERQP